MAIPIKAVLSVSAKGFNVGIKGATKVLGGLVAITKMAAFAVVGLTAAFTAIVARQAQVIDRLGKVSKVTGVAAETLQKFQFAAELAGVSSDQAAVALRRFSRRLGEAQKGTGELAPTLNRLGISLRDSNGQFKDAEQVLFELADGIKNTEGESAKLSIAFKAFDSEGAELVNTLAEGGDALKEVFNRAEALGFVLSTSAIQGVEDFNDSFKELTTLVGGIVNQLVANLAPALDVITKELTEFVLELSREFGGVENLGEAMAIGLVEAIETIILSFMNLQTAVVNFINDFRFFARNLGFRDMTADAQAFQDVLDIMDKELASISGGKPLDRFSKELSTTIAAMNALKRISEQVDDVLPGLMPEQLMEYEDNLTAILTTFNALSESGETNAFRQKQALEDVQELLNRNIELVQEGLVAQVFSNDQLIDSQATYFTILKLLNEAKAAILENNDATGDGNDELEKTRTLLDDIKEAFGNLSERLGDPLKRVVKTLEDGLVKGVEMFEDSLADAVINGKADFDDLAAHLKQVLAKAMIQKFITGPILAAFGLGGKAKGGPVSAGQPYIVGEEGMEIFRPNTSGTIIPNHALGGMSGGPGMAMGGQQVTYNINAVDTQSFQQALARDPEFLFNVTQRGARSLPSRG